MFHRQIRLPERQSFFLFGARQTGKSTLLRERFGDVRVLRLDLLDPETEDALRRNPRELLQRLDALREPPSWVVLDEVQKIPRLLDVVHARIEQTGQKFALTGSSPRKLRRGASNLLAGRAMVHHLHPLTHRELGEAFDLGAALRWGTLPKVFALDEAERIAFLRAYALTYVKEEIAAEQVVRRLDPFRNFLEVAAQSNGKVINYSNVARDVGVEVKTVQSYFAILEDTLMGFLLPPFHESLRKRQSANPKFYFFDLGLKRALERTLDLSLEPRTYGYGDAFEHFVIAELRRLADYAGKDWRYSYLRTPQDAEIDLIVERPGAPRVFLEIKSSETVRDADVANLNRFAADSKVPVTAILASRDPVAKRIGETLCLPWDRALEEILGG
jgi:predicted AAA+ superfamily ATPase